MKSLTIEVAIPLPDDMFAQAELLTNIAPVLKTFRDALGGVSADATVTQAMTTPRPRKPKSDANVADAPDLTPTDAEKDVTLAEAEPAPDAPAVEPVTFAPSRSRRHAA